MVAEVASKWNLLKGEVVGISLLVNRMRDQLELREL